MSVDRRRWLHHVQDVVRSRHYTWLPRGLGGHSVDEAMTYLVTDIMHVCKLADVSFECVLENSREKFEEQEAAGCELIGLEVVH